MKISALAALLLLAGAARAAPISTYPAASALTGAETMISSQGTATVNISTSQLQNYALTSLKSYGAAGDGVTDDTAAIQTAIDTGAPFTCKGVYKTTATLTFNTTASEGLGINGSGPLGLDGVANPQRCVIKPSAAVTVAFNIDGVSRGGYVNGLEINNITLDMTNMAAGSKGFLQGQTFDLKYRNVRVMGDTSKFAWYMGPGAFVTHLDTVQGHTVTCTGNGIQNPTTLLISNPDILELDAYKCANVTTVGGAIQFRYNPGVTPIIWVASGDTNLLAFYDTIAAANAANGTTGGMYYAVGSTFDNMNNLQSLGTDWEALDFPGNACTPLSGGGTWTAGTYDDGTHGCHPIVWVPQITSSVRGCEFHTPVFGNEYLYSPQTNGCTITGAYMPGNATQNIHNTLDVFNAGAWLNKGQSIFGYDSTGVQSLLVDGGAGGFAGRYFAMKPAVNGVVLQLTSANNTSNGYIATSDTPSSASLVFGGLIIGNSLKAQPSTPANANAFLIIDSTNTIQTLNCGTAAAAPIGVAGCSFGYGADAQWFSDGFGTLKAYVRGTSGNASFGTIGGTTITASTAFAGPINGTVGATTPNTGAFTTLAASTSILSTGPTGGLGYAAGAGGAVTQATSRTTGVTLNKTTGAITLVSAAGLATYQTFTVTDSAVAATDTVVLSQKSGTDKYILLPTAIAAGSFAITFATTGGTTTEQPVLNFTVIKGAAS